MHTRHLRQACRTKGPHVRRDIYERVKVSDGVYRYSTFHLAATNVQGLGGWSGSVTRTSVGCFTSAGAVRKQAATGCGRKRNTVRNRRVRACPLQLRQANRKSPPEVE